MVTRTFENEDNDMLNAEAWAFIDKYGLPLVFGDASERKTAKWITSTIVFGKKNIDKLRRGIMPEGWLFRNEMVRGYIEQFDNEEMWEGFEYTYAERLLKLEIPNPDYPDTVKDMLWYMLKNFKVPPKTIRVNQLEHMCEQLKEAFRLDIQSTRIVADLGLPHIDWNLNDIPCLRAIQVLPLPGKQVEIHFLFRSHDYGNGYGANMAMLINAINKHVVYPAGGVISKVVLTSWVAHLYDTDESMYRPVIENYNKEMEKGIMIGESCTSECI